MHLLKSQRAERNPVRASYHALLHRFAHIANRMGVSDGNFEKGEADGTVASLRLIEAVARH